MQEHNGFNGTGAVTIREIGTRPLDPLQNTPGSWFARHRLPSQSAPPAYMGKADSIPFMAMEDGCWFNALCTRLKPSHAIELTVVSLDRNVAATVALT